MATEFYKLEFYVPADYAEKVKAAVFAAGAGRIGNYDCCCWETAGTGQFRPLPGSQPFIGGNGQLEHVGEIKVEMVCGVDYIDQVVAALRQAHPYETPAYQYWKVTG